jgi:hypothetical protein
MILLNTHKIRKTRSEWKDRIRPTEDEVTDESVESPGIAQTIGLSLLADVAALAHIAVLLPYYVSNRDSIKGALKHRHWAYLPHAVLLGAAGVARPLLGGYIIIETMVVSYYVYKTAGIGLVNSLSAGKSESELNDPTSVDDDHYFLPVSERRDASQYADYEVQLEKEMSTLATGESRSGKTSAIKMLAAQLAYGPDTAVVAHGSVGEYSEFFASQLGLDILVVGESDSDAIWNLFREIPERAERHDAERQIRQISETMITEGDTNSPYFPRAARDIFVGLCMRMWEKHDEPHHGHIRQAIRSDPAEVAEALADAGYSDAASKAVDDGEASDEWATMTSQLKKMFVGDFGAEGTFSFREYIDNPRGRVVVVESPEAMRGTGSVYAAMLDEAISSMIASSDQRTIAILDEIDTLAPLQLIGDLAARGAAQNSPMIIGVQTVAQLRAVYGREKAAGLIGNCQQLIGLSPGTADCIEVLQSALGERRETVKSTSKNYNLGGKGLVTPSVGSSKREVERAPIPDEQMNNWRPGEGIVVGRDCWWYCRLGDPDDWIPTLRDQRGSVVASTPGRSRAGRRDDLEHSRDNDRGSDDPLNPDYNEDMAVNVWDDTGRRD